MRSEVTATGCCQSVSQPLAEASPQLSRLLTLDCMASWLPAPGQTLLSHQCCRVCKAATLSEACKTAAKLAMH